MRAIRLTTKFFAIAAILAVAFGPLTTVLVKADVPDPNNPQAYYGPTNALANKSPASQGWGSTGDTAASECSGITGCAASMIYSVGPGFASWVASWSAYFFDFIVRIALSSDSYSLTFLTLGWNIVLSMANMFFIFILIYAAFVIMLRAETARTLQTLAWVIAIALVVNFSFFFTRVVIDAGNILATQFYNANLTTRDAYGNLVQVPSLNTGTPDITASFMNAIGVESLLGSNSFNSISSQMDGSSWSTFLVLMVIFLFAAAMFWILAIALFMVGIKFFLRVVGLWLILIASPLAFVAQTLSNTRHFFEKWLRALVSLSLYPAVFLFMFWVLNQFASQLTGGAGGLSQLLTTNAVGQAAGVGTGATANPYPVLVLIANVSIRMMFIIMLMYVMLKVTDWIMEQAGNMASGTMNWVSGGILGGSFRTAAWAGAFAGRNTAGRLANRIANNGSISQRANNSALGRALWRGTVGLSRSTYDLRNAPGGSTVRGGVETITGRLNLGTPSKKNAADEQKRIDELNKRLRKQASANARQREEATKVPAATEEKAAAPSVPSAGTTASAAPTAARPTSRLVGSTSDVAHNPISETERENRLSMPSRTPSPAAPGAAAPATRYSPEAAMSYGAQRLFAQQKEEEKRRVAAAGTTAAHLMASQPNMGLSAKAAADIARAQAPIAQRAVQAEAPVQGVAQAVAAIKGQEPMPQRIEVHVPTSSASTTHTVERTKEIHEVKTVVPEAGVARVAAETRRFTREELGKLRDNLSNMARSTARHTEHKIDEVAHRERLETDERLDKLAKKIQNIPHDSVSKPTNTATPPGAMEPLDDDVPPHYREAAE